MALNLYLFVIWCAFGSLVNGINSAYSIPTSRMETTSSLSRPFGNLQHVEETKSFYWFGNFTVGLSKNIQLLLDTGSPHVLLNPGVYKPSPASKPFYFPHFRAQFEGINKKGTGTVVAKGDIFVEHVTNGHLTVSNQTIGNITSFHAMNGRTKSGLLPGIDGTIGFQGIRNTEWINSTTYNVTNVSRTVGSWFYNLCRYKIIPECRFGMAFGTYRIPLNTEDRYFIQHRIIEINVDIAIPGTNHKGLQIIGGVDKSLIKTELTRAPLDSFPYGLWSTRADITLDNKIIIKNQTVILDTGTTNIQAPSDIARQIFKTLDYPYVRQSEPGLGAQTTYHFLHAFFPCDKPPVLGFSFPAEYDLMHPKHPHISTIPKIFNVLKSEWPFKNNGDNNCTLALSGTNDETFPPLKTKAWVIGQPFYQGHYVDHHIRHSIGFADLLDPSNVGGH